MGKKRILVPIDGTERSMHSIDFIRGIFPRDSVEIVLINVKELILIDGMSVADELKVSQKLGEELLQNASKVICEYPVKTLFTFGYAGDEIIRASIEEFIDIIVMTKSTKKGLTRMIGSVTVNVVKHAKCIVMIVPE